MDSGSVQGPRELGSKRCAKKCVQHTRCCGQCHEQCQRTRLCQTTAALIAGMCHSFAATSVDVHCDGLCNTTKRVQLKRCHWHKGRMAAGKLHCGDGQNVRPAKDDAHIVLCPSNEHETRMFADRKQRGADAAVAATGNIVPGNPCVLGPRPTCCIGDT